MADPLFDAVEALLARTDAPELLPEPAERERLRLAAGFTVEDVARALRIRPATLLAWERGDRDPHPDKAAAYCHLLEGLTQRFPPPATAPAAAAVPQPDVVSSAVAPAAAPDRDAAGELLLGAPEPCVLCGQLTPYRSAGAPRHLGDFCRSLAPADLAAMPTSAPVPPPVAAPTAPAPASATAAPRRGPAAAAAPQDPRFPLGPLAVLDGNGAAFLADGRTVPCPAASLPELVAWALAEAGLGAPRLHRSGKDGDPLVALTADAATALGLPLELADRRGLRLPDDHPVVKQLTKAKWQLTRRGFGPWARIYRPAADGRRHCVQLAVLPWGALDSRSWADAGERPAAEVARVLGTYAQRVLTPRGSTAVCGLELMTALRPPTRAVRGADGGWVSGPVPGSLTGPVDPAPCEAPDEHPVAAGRAAGEVLDEEAYEWHRDPALVDAAERERPFAVAVDLMTAFLAAANRLSVGLGPAVHDKAPIFDRKLPGSWYVDLSGVRLDPRLPSPFTPHGQPPTGPAWYATPTVAYAVELGAEVTPLEAWTRPEHGPYLDPWYGRLRDAYLATMAELGVTPDLDQEAFLRAMEQHQQVDPVQSAVLSAIKATVKGGVGKLRERPQGAGYRPGERWGALERATWRPDIRAALIATARVNMHRKMARTAAAAGLYPLGVLSDCVVYAGPGPSPLDVLPRTPEGVPVPGSFRLGVSPGMVKHEGTRPMAWALDLLGQGLNPARHIKGDAVLDGE